MVDICRGIKSKNEVLAESIECYKHMFMWTKVESEKLVAVSMAFSPARPRLITSYRLSVIASTDKVPYRRPTLARPVKKMAKTVAGTLAAGGSAVAEEGEEAGAAV